MSAIIQKLEIWQSCIPMRSFEHAAATRDRAQAVLVKITLSDGRCGWGETMARKYVTGQDNDEVVATIIDVLWPAIAGKAADDLPSLPESVDGVCINSAICAIDLAVMDLRLQASPMHQDKITAKVTGVLGSSDPNKTMRRLSLMMLYGMKDFKLKLGMGQETDAANLHGVLDKLGRRLSAGKCTLRVDVNGGWDADSTPSRIRELSGLGVCAVEQPIYCDARRLVELSQECIIPLIADESLLTIQDAEILASAGRKIIWNVRLCKNGGISGAARMCGMAKARGIDVIIGCMVGESGLLSAAQRRLLGMIASPLFVEGNYGRFLLRDDLTQQKLRFGYGGKLTSLGGPGLGATFDPKKLARYCKPVKTLTI